MQEKPCYYCRYLAAILSDQIIQRRLNRYNSIVMGQAMCQQHGWDRALGFPVSLQLKDCEFHEIIICALRLLM